MGRREHQGDRDRTPRQEGQQHRLGGLHNGDPPCHDRQADGSGSPDCDGIGSWIQRSDLSGRPFGSMAADDVSGNVFKGASWSVVQGSRYPEKSAVGEAHELALPANTGLCPFGSAKLLSC